jgi:hypothetical protein
MRKHLGSTLAIILGLVALGAGILQPGFLLITGPVILLGAFAYRSAKRRRLREVPNNKLRLAVELMAMALLIGTVVLQADFKQAILEDPIPNVVIPLWAVVAYLVGSWPRKAHRGIEMAKGH